MSQHPTEHSEANLGNVRASNSSLDGGAMLSTASLADIHSMRLTGSTQLHDVGFTVSGTGLAGNDAKNRNDKASDIRISFDNITMTPESSNPFSRLFRSHDEETLHEKVSDRVKEGMDPKQRTELEHQQKAYDKAMKGWSMMVGIGIKPPSLDDYPLVKEHEHKVADIEHGITKKVIDGLTPQEKEKLEHESNPLGPGFAPKPMTEEVLRRVREATKKYLEPNSAATPSKQLRI